MQTKNPYYGESFSAQPSQWELIIQKAKRLDKVFRLFWRWTGRVCGILFLIMIIGFILAMNMRITVPGHFTIILIYSLLVLPLALPIIVSLIVWWKLPSVPPRRQDRAARDIPRHGCGQRG